MSGHLDSAVPHPPDYAPHYCSASVEGAKQTERHTRQTSGSAAAVTTVMTDRRLRPFTISRTTFQIRNNVKLEMLQGPLMRPIRHIYI